MLLSIKKLHAFPVDNYFNRKCGKRIYSFNSSLNKTTKCFQKSIENPVKHKKWVSILNAR